MKAHNKVLVLIICGLIGFSFGIVPPRNTAFSRKDSSQPLPSGMTQNLYIWSTAEVVSTVSSARSLRPDIAIDTNDNVHVVWEDLTPYSGSGGDADIFYRQWNAATQAWLGTQVISTESSSNSLAPNIAADEFGNLHTVWMDTTNYGGAGIDSDIFFKLWNSTTGSWGPTEVVSSESNAHGNWPIVAAYKGETFVVWQDSSIYGGAGSDVDIFYKHRFQNGSWTLSEVVSTESSALSRFPSITLDTDVNIHVVWDDATNYNGAGNDEDVFYKYKNRTTGVWSLTEVVSTESTGHSERAKIAIDGINNRHVTWFDITNYNGAGVDRDIFYKRWNSTSASWMLTEVVTTESISTSEVPSIVVDIIGNVFCFWFDTTNIAGAGTDQDIFFKIWNVTLQAWSSVVVVSKDSLGDSWRPNAAVDSKLRLHVIWHDRTAGYGGSGNDIDILYAYGYLPSLIVDLTIIQSPGDVIYEYSTTGNNLRWVVADINVTNPTYAVYRDSIEITNQSWTAYNPIVVNIDNLTFGFYNYTFVATDGWGNYEIDASNVSVTNFPPRVISSPNFMMFPEGSIGHLISWVVVDQSLSNPTYAIYRDGIQIETGIWSSGIPITITIDGLTLGDYTYQLLVVDGFGGNSEDVVQVRVTSPVNPLIELFPSLFWGIMIALAPVVLTVLIFRRRR